jgi:hypothetical protein
MATAQQIGDAMELSRSISESLRPGGTHDEMAWTPCWWGSTLGGPRHGGLARRLFMASGQPTKRRHKSRLIPIPTVAGLEALAPWVFSHFPMTEILKSAVLICTSLDRVIPVPGAERGFRAVVCDEPPAGPHRRHSVVG